jgi:hypothetical protein
MEIKNETSVKPLNIIIVEKTGTLKSLAIKDYKEEELYKKCGFKKSEDFIKHHEWSNIKIDGSKYTILVYAKDDGRPNSENKYDFPPPIDTKLFFGNCALLAKIKKSDGSNSLTDLTITLWNKIYEKLFGGFEDLNTTAKEDENEEDELDKIPKEKKTKNGYLKDGFVVDSDDESLIEYSESDIENISDKNESTNKTDESENNDIDLDEIGSELNNEEYDYDEDDSKNVL